MRNDPGGMISTSSVISGRCCAEAIALQLIANRISARILVMDLAVFVGHQRIDRIVIVYRVTVNHKLWSRAIR